MAVSRVHALPILARLDYIKRGELPVQTVHAVDTECSQLATENSAMRGFHKVAITRQVWLKVLDQEAQPVPFEVGAHLVEVECDVFDAPNSSRAVR